jgi:hypothetical protein
MAPQKGRKYHKGINAPGGPAGFQPLHEDRTDFWELVRIFRADPELDLKSTVAAHKWHYSTFMQRCSRERDRQNIRDGTAIPTGRDWLHGRNHDATRSEANEESTVLMIRDTMLSLLREMQSAARLKTASLRDIAYMYSVLSQQHPDVMFAPASTSKSSTPANVAITQDRIAELYASVPPNPNPKTKKVASSRLKPAVRMALEVRDE